MLAHIGVQFGESGRGRHVNFNGEFLMVSALQFFLFIPKILHVFRETRDGEAHNAVIVTGLDDNNEEAVGLYTQGGTR